jgi:hypothetical protein
MARNAVCTCLPSSLNMLIDVIMEIAAISPTSKLGVQLLRPKRIALRFVPVTLLRFAVVAIDFPTTNGLAHLCTPGIPQPAALRVNIYS